MKKKKALLIIAVTLCMVFTNQKVYAEDFEKELPNDIYENQKNMEQCLIPDEAMQSENINLGMSENSDIQNESTDESEQNLRKEETL